ncbi:MAG TPA: CHC2 zinc finger domain-containing protein [Pyrinomonadaceae bacterium]|jgi:DNA primase
MERDERDVGRLRRLSEQIKSSIDYRSFYTRYCHAQARISSNRLQSLCPIPHHAHSGRGNPSLSVDLERGLFHCFSRDEGGDCIRFYELMHSVGFVQAVNEIARELGLTASHTESSLIKRAAPDMEVPEYQGEPLATDRLAEMCEAFLAACREEEQAEGRNYLARRGIDERSIRLTGVTYFPRRAYRRVMGRMLEAFPIDELKLSGLFNQQSHLTFYRHRLLFPFYVEGRALYLQARTTASGVEPRWHNMRGPVPSLYNVDSLEDLSSKEVVYLVEGFTDTLTLLTHGFAAVGLVGAGGLKEEWLAPLGRFSVVAALDPDAAGERAVARYQEMFSARGMQLAQLELPSDVNEFFQHHPSAPLEFKLLTEAALESLPS